MKQGFKIGIIGWLMVLLSLCLYADEAKGYKVVLASSATLDEAKSKLTSLEGKLGEHEWALQEKYHFEILARASGKAFIVCIEPLATKEDANEVMKQFNHLYPDSYSNGYFGPTEGSLVLKHPQATPMVEEMNQSTTKKVEAPVESKPSEAVYVPKEEGGKSSLFLMAAAGAVVLMAILFFGFIRRKSSKVKASDQIEKEVSKEKNIEKNVPEMKESIIVRDVPVIESSSSDIFYRLKRNIFFMTLLKELKEASDVQEASLCSDLMEEIMRYQKNFQKSTAITTLEQLVQNEDFAQLSAVLHNEIS